MKRDIKLRLELQVEEMIINSHSSRVTADEIVQLVIEVTEGKKLPKPLKNIKPWEKFAVNKDQKMNEGTSIANEINKLRNSIYREGYEIASNGGHASDNPYSLNHERDRSELELWWQEGYYDCTNGYAAILLEE